MGVRDPEAAVKYVALEDLGVLGRGGRVTLVGENRAQELEAKAERVPRVPLALHRPAPVAQGQADRAARRADPLGRVRVRAAPARAPRRRRRPRSCSRSTSRARRARRASPRTSSPRYLELLAGDGRGPDDDAAVRARIPRPAGRISRACASSPTSTGCKQLSHGHVAGLRRRCSRGCNHRADRHYALHVGCAGKACPAANDFPDLWP